MQFIQKHLALFAATIALVLSGCNTFTDLRPPPNVYANVEGPAEVTLTTLKTFGAAQDTFIEVCGTVQAEDPQAPACIALGTAEQTLRPAATAVGQVAYEYADIDARIRELGPNAPAEWLLAAAEVAGRLSAAYEPIRADVDAFIVKAGELAD
jgi:hypothetical protein